MDPWNPVKGLKGRREAQKPHTPGGSSSRRTEQPCVPAAVCACLHTAGGGGAHVRPAPEYFRARWKPTAAVTRKCLFQPEELWPPEGSLTELSRCHAKASWASECPCPAEASPSYFHIKVVGLETVLSLSVDLMLSCRFLLSCVHGISCFWGQHPGET